jgi:hypothetical protein
VALSFAGAQRPYVEQVASALEARGLRVFYDADDEQIERWGRSPAEEEELRVLYAEQAAAVVVFVSADYAAWDWTRLERRTALDQAARDRRAYVLPARFDDTALPGALAGLVAVDLRGLEPEAFADLVEAKLTELGIASPPSGPPPGVLGERGTGVSAAQGGVARPGEAAVVNVGGSRNRVNVYQGASPPTAPSTPSLHAAVIGTTLMSAAGAYRLDTGSLPHAFLGSIGSDQLSAADRVRENLGLRMLVELPYPSDLPAGLATVISLPPASAHDDDAVIDLYRRLHHAWPAIRSSPELLPPEVVTFAEYAAFSEVILIEESPARRTSAAGQAAAALTSRIMTTGTAATLCSASLDGEHVVAVVVVGGGATIVLSSAGAAVTILSHWIGRRLNI